MCDPGSSAAPVSAANTAICGARSAVSRPSPPTFFSAVMRAVVIIPRSPTITMFSRAKVSFTAVTAAVNATGQPAGSVSSAYSICGRPFLPSRAWPRSSRSDLAAQHVVHRGVHLVGARAGDGQVRAEGDVVPGGQGGQFYADATAREIDQRQRQVPHPPGRAEQRGQPELLRDDPHRGDVAVWHRPVDAHHRRGVHQVSTGQYRPDRGDRRIRQV